jgi:hypothetical protein
LSPEEASLSLEQEMQKAASFAVVGKPDPAEIAPTVSEPDTVTMAMVELQTPVVEAPAPIIEASAAPTAIEQAPESQATPSFADVPSRVSEPFRAEVPDFTVAAPPVSEQPREEAIPYVTSALESVVSSEVVSSEVASSEKEPDLPAKVEEVTPADVVKAMDSVEAKTAEPEASDPAVQKLSEEKISEETKSEEESPKDQMQAEHKVVAAEVIEPGTASDDSEAASKETIDEVSTSSSASPTAGGTDQMAKKESEISATTAAAWASWRKIRETGGSKTAKDSEDVSEPKDEAAKAVAVGAESNPEEVAALDSDPEIANIVDSVLADMRPKIVEEIAKKLGKKK